MGRFFGSRFWGPRSVTGGGSPPAAPTWSVADNGDGTGAVATILTAGASTTNTVYVERFDQTLGQGSWVSAGSRSGTGAIALDLDPGHYLGYVKSVATGGDSVSTPRYFAVTSGADSVHYRCLQAVYTRVRAAALSGVADASIVLQELPNPRRFISDMDTAPSGKLDLPGVIVSGLGTNTRDKLIQNANWRSQKGYPCLISIFRAYNQVLTLDDVMLKWREQLDRAFDSQRLPGVLESIKCEIEEQPVILPEAWLSNLWHTAILVRVQCREIRGMGA